MGRPLPPSKAAIVMAIAAFFAVIFFGIVKSHSQEVPAPQEPSAGCPGATIDDMAAHMQGWQSRGLGFFRILDQSETAEFLAAYNSVPPVSRLCRLLYRDILRTAGHASGGIANDSRWRRLHVRFTMTTAA
jgi:hypothetical protein